MTARFFRLLLGALIVAASSGSTTLALAQVPAHPPGTICFTERFWCWAQPPGPPGTGCICRTPQGDEVPGVRG